METIDALGPFRPFASEPYAHQAEALLLSARKRSFALLHEQGTGKSKVLIDTAAFLYRNNKISALFVIAPNDVHIQWAIEQIPAHLHSSVPRKILIWNRSSKRMLEELRKYIKRGGASGALLILCMNHEALATTRGFQLAKEFVRAMPTLLALDESHAFKNPNSKRTRRATIIGEYAFARRILSGTPITQSPFDAFAQFTFLDERILNQPSFLAYKHRYGEFTKEYVHRGKKPDGSAKLIEYEQLTSYANLGELESLITPYCHRALKSECVDLPEKIYTIRLTHLSSAQKQYYNRLKEQGLLLLSEVEQGKPCKMPLDPDVLEESELAERIVNPKDRLIIKIKLTLMMRLQQIAGGFFTDDEKTITAIDSTPNPRQVATLELVQNALAYGGKVIVWAQFRPELVYLSKFLSEHAAPTVLVYGGQTKSARTEAIERFKDPSSADRILIAHARSAGTGLNLTVARTSIYYSKSYSVALRLQSEDRIHRIGQSHAVHIVDVHAHDAPVDRVIYDSIKDKSFLSTNVLNWRSMVMRSIL